MHIGYAVNTPTIGIFQHVGNGRPDLVGPYKLDKTFFPIVSYLEGAQAWKRSEKNLKPSVRQQSIDSFS